MPAAYRQPVQRAAVVLPLQHAVAADLGAAEQPGDLGAELREGGGEARQRAGRQLGGRQRGQTDVQRAAPLLVHLVNPHLQRARHQEKEKGGGEGAEPIAVRKESNKRKCISDWFRHTYSITCALSSSTVGGVLLFSSVSWEKGASRPRSPRTARRL